ncbi:hypothetical protein EC991_006013 [Linnemannia zychae]|nr:hypothetical protein EC991_006013 [Linnemannia zychae]
MKLTIAAILALCAPSVCLGLVGNSWKFASAPSDGLDDVTFSFNIANAPHKRGFYFAQQFNFKNTPKVGYTGLQPQVDAKGKSVIRGVFSSFQGGTTTKHPNCHPGADGGPGVSCAVLIDGDYNHTYNLVVENIGGTSWRGTLVDTVTSAATIVGEWTLPAGSGKIVNGQVGFVEYFIWNGLPSFTCDSCPYTEAIFYDPTSKTTGASGGKITRVYDYGTCKGKVQYSSAPINGGYEIKVGFKQILINIIIQNAAHATKKRTYDSLLQAVRTVHKHTLQPVAPAIIAHLGVHADASSGKNIVLWDDVVQAFKDALHVRHGTRILPFLKGPDFKNLEPSRFAAVPNSILDVVVEDQTTDNSAVPSQESTPTSTMEPISQQEIIVANMAQRRNPVYGLVEAAMENLTHIDRPNKFARGPQLYPANSPKDRPQNSVISRQPPDIKPPPDDKQPQRLQPKAIQQHSSKYKFENFDAQTMLEDLNGADAAVIQESIDVLQMAVEREDAEYQYRIGLQYVDGQGVAQDFSKALKWLLKAANQGHAPAQLQVANIYRFGLGRAKDSSKALKWFLRAADQGYGDAEYNVGMMYDTGNGVAKDSSISMKWFLKAAEHENAYACWQIGFKYKGGHGVPLDYSKAREWYWKAAEKGHPNGQDNIDDLELGESKLIF